MREQNNSMFSGTNYKRAYIIAALSAGLIIYAELLETGRIQVDEQHALAYAANCRAKADALMSFGPTVLSALNLY